MPLPFGGRPSLGKQHTAQLEGKKTVPKLLKENWAGTAKFGDSSPRAMPETILVSIWKQFASSIDMLGNAIRSVPVEEWDRNKRLFYTAYHSLLFLDYYLTVPPTAFRPGLACTLVPPDQMPAEALDDLVPDHAYSQAQCLAWLQASRLKCRQLLSRLDLEGLTKCWIDAPDMFAPACVMHFNVLDILLYNLRHVQHHTAQLNLLLRQMGLVPPDWEPEPSHAEDQLG